MGLVPSNEPQTVVHRTGCNLMQASQFYTGLVAEMYDLLVSYQAPVSFFADLIRNGGEPALELGCGTGHPLLPLLAQGLRVEGLDSSRDMLTRCEAKASAQGLHVTLHQQEMQNLALPTRYRTIFFAGASFMLLPDLHDAERTLHRIYHHLEPGGRAVIPLYVPPLSPEAESADDQWRSREKVREEDGATLRFSERFHYDRDHRFRVATLRYEVLHTSQVTESEERPWVLRWYLQEEFRQLLLKAGFASAMAMRENGKPAKESDPAFVFIASR